MKVQENVPLAPLTTFKIGGNARYFVEVKSTAELLEAIAWAKEKNVRYFFLAGASNVLVPDAGLEALVIRIIEGDILFSGSIVIADAGCSLLGLIHTASENSLGGMEKLAGIPGTIGGAVRGNAGAFGSEIKDFAISVKAINTGTGKVRDFPNDVCQFSYRSSFFKMHPEWIVMQVTLQLVAVDAGDSKTLSEETIAEREKRHLQNVRAAGSYFMNPVAPADIVAMFEKENGVESRENRVPAGWLIEKAGMKGATVGGAQASMQHPNYIVNTGNATAKDVRDLALMIKIEVTNQFGVELQEEASLL